MGKLPRNEQDYRNAQFLPISLTQGGNCMQCPKCIDTDHPILVGFNRRRGIVGSVSVLRAHMHAAMEMAYPELLALFGDPQRWLDGSPPWLALGATRLNLAEVLIEVVEAPAGFDAALLRLKCATCNNLTSLVVVNAGFIALAKHIFACSHGEGLPLAALRNFIAELRTDAKRLPFAAGPSRDLVTSGFSWIACHELAHATQGRLVDTSSLGVPGWCRDDVQAELDADVTALRALQHRIHATPSAGRASDRLHDLFDGVALVLRTCAFVSSLRTGRSVSLDDPSSVFDDGSPTPSLRWKVIAQDRDVLVKLGMLESRPNYQEPFNSWDVTAAKILKELI
jgi:hypothetical protein